MDDFLRKAGRALEGLAGEAGRQAEIVRLQARLGSLDEDLDRVFIEAGKRARELLTMRRIHDEELKVILERAKQIEAEMMQVRRQIQDLRQDKAGQEEPADAAERRCPACQVIVTDDAVFCPHCGVRVK